MDTPDLDELMKLLEERAEKREEVNKSRLDSCDKFIQKKVIVQGLDRVPNYVIYYTYKQVYKAGLGEEKWAKNHFFQLFNRHFNQARTGRQRYYLLDGKSFDLSRAGLLEAKKYNEEYQIKIKKARGTLPEQKRRYTKRSPYWSKFKKSED